VDILYGFLDHTLELESDSLPWRSRCTCGSEGTVLLHIPPEPPIAEPELALVSGNSFFNQHAMSVFGHLV
jgi:hypothetical protein